ncbi:Krueppel-like factor 6 [Thelohanellus kitauei]|uniref:Krueppel-like factor 6 n=1 Tax=Thelohanellus kitauei TaxID=669202 RepID=A0A0C2MP25_THEKT|nr:Krueppel-like factor 6 [Thelohanellus kitauei]
MYPIFLFRKKVCHEFKDDSTDIKFGPLCLCIKEKVKFDRKLFGKMKVIKRRPILYSKDGKLYMEKHQCMHDGCRKILLSKRHLKTHYLYHCEIKPFRCNVINCNARYAEFENVKRHVNRHPRPLIVKCPFCDFVYDATGMKDHVITHPETKQMWENFSMSNKIQDIFDM